jgi:hypothetical protein
LSSSAPRSTYVMRGTAAKKKKKTNVVASRVFLRGWILSILVR